ncbi:MAG: DUF2891 domain-containing protein [Myxococcota bacterium]
MTRAAPALAFSLLVSACTRTSAPEPTPEALPESPPAFSEGDLGEGPEARFLRLALDCIHRPYPNKISHVLRSDEDVAPPRALTPAFHGCFDWHSAVHGHWMLVRWLRRSEGPRAEMIRAALDQSFTEAKMVAELAYYRDRPAFERPYGIAWYLQLVAELEEAREDQWRARLRPLEEAIVGNLMTWLENLAYPIRLGTHNQSAFAFGLMLDYADTVGRKELRARLVEKSRVFHAKDRNCPLHYEPSGEDFLSPCLMEADLMRRVFGADSYGRWLDGFLPHVPRDGDSNWLEPGVVLDPSDGKLVHLDGLNISRAWALEGIASALPSTDARRPALQAAARRHREVGLASVTGEHYEGGHWLASFATYLITQRGLR